MSDELLINEWLKKIKCTAPDSNLYKTIKNHWDNIAKPIDGLGQFEEIVCQCGAVLGAVKPDISKRAVVVMCADNGIVNEGVSQSGQDITSVVARLIGEGNSSVCTLAKAAAIDTFGVDIGIAGHQTFPGIMDCKIKAGTNDFLVMPAMSIPDTLRAIDMGIDVVRDLKARGYKLLATGEMGIGNTTTSTALLCAYTGEKTSSVTGRGAGLDDEGLKRKIAVIKEGLVKYGYAAKKIDSGDKVAVIKALSELGGFDIAGLTGMYIGAAINHVPVIIDGLISAVAALIAEFILPGAKDFMIPSHSGKEMGVSMVLEHLGLKPLINGGMALGEGSGAVMLIPVLDMVFGYYNHGLSFEEYDMEAYERKNNS